MPISLKEKLEINDSKYALFGLLYACEGCGTVFLYKVNCEDHEDNCKIRESILKGD